MRRFGYVVSGLVAASVLAVVASHCSAATGCTSLIGFSAERHVTELPVLRQIPHAHADRQGYDGEFYAQLALDPTLRDPVLDLAIDNVPYRAHRMLFSWTAYALGLGRPAWILQAYALQNVAAWLLLAWLLVRWHPVNHSRALALWTGSLLTVGLLTSVRFALTDAPATVLVVLSVLAVEHRRPRLAAALLGVAALGRETMFVAAGALVGQARDVRTFLRRSFDLSVALVPFGLWFLYLLSKYGSSAWDGAGNVVGFPLRGLMWKLRDISLQLAHGGLDLPAVASLTALMGFAIQSAVVVRALLRDHDRSPWALVGGIFLILTLMTQEAVWGGTPGAYTRVALPMTFAANILLARRHRASWGLIVAANIGVIAGVLVLLDKV